MTRITHVTHNDCKNKEDCANPDKMSNTDICQDFDFSKERRIKT